jgi:hypothetical protein
VFSGANLIEVIDPDVGAGLIEVDLVASNGVLNLAQATGLVFVTGGDGTAAMLLRGTLADINAALDGMAYTPNLGYEGAAVVQITTNDLGNTPGPALTSGPPDIIDITVTNRAPTMSAQTLSIDENSAAGTLVGTVVASDPDLSDPLTYSIVSGNTSGAFSIDAATGEVRVVDASLLPTALSR